MTGSDRDLAVRLTEHVVAVEGVRGIFPQSVVAAAVAVVTGSVDGGTGVVQVERTAGVLDVTARLAVDSGRPSLDVVRAVAEAVRRHSDGRQVRLHLEIAHLT